MLIRNAYAVLDADAYTSEVLRPPLVLRNVYTTGLLVMSLMLRRPSWHLRLNCDALACF